MFEFESNSFTGIASDIFLIDDVDINKTNNVTFDITGIDDAYFQRYNVFHEYINVTDEVLLWRGKKYLRGRFLNCVTRKKMKTCYTNENIKKQVWAFASENNRPAVA